MLIKINKITRHKFLVFGAIAGFAGLAPLWISPLSLPWILIPTLILTAILWSKHAHRVLFSPVALLAIGWLIPSLATYFEPEWALNLETWAVILTSYLAFVAGYFISISIWLSKYKIQSMSAIKMWDKYKFRKALKLIFMLAIFGFVINLANVYRHGGLFIYRYMGFREVERIFAFHPLTNYLYFLNGLVVILSIIYLKWYGRTFSVLLQMGVSFIALFFHTVAGTVLFLIVADVYAYWFLSKRPPIQALIALFLSAFLAFSFFSIGRGYIAPSHSIGQMAQAVAQRMYHYMAPNYANLQMEMMNRQDYLWGVNTLLSPILTLISLKGRIPILKLELPETQFYLVYGAYNVGTYLRDFFVDFGLCGVLFGPFILGFITTIFFGKFILNPTVRNLLIYSIIATMITFTFWYNEFTRIQFWYWIAIIWLIDKFLAK
jgi:oligosaccharide repeat unit polymerase